MLCVRGVGCGTPEKFFVQTPFRTEHTEHTEHTEFTKVIHNLCFSPCPPCAQCEPPLAGLKRILRVNPDLNPARRTKPG